MTRVSGTSALQVKVADAMLESSEPRLQPSTQTSLLGVAGRGVIRDDVAARVERLRLALHNSAQYGFAVRVAHQMGWRAEHRSRELSGVDGLSVSTVYADLLLHENLGEWLAVDAITAALIGGLRTTSLNITPGAVVRLFEKNGQLVLRFDK